MRAKFVPGLTLVLHAIVASVLAGAGIVIVLTTGYVSAGPIIGAILAGLVFGWPIARLIAKELHKE